MHGGDIYSNDIELDFSVNLNPLGAPEGILRAVRESAVKAGQYPDPEYRALRKEISRKYGVSPSRIVCGNGASELIMAVCRAAAASCCGCRAGRQRETFAAGVSDAAETPEAGPLKAVILVPGFTGYRRALSAVHAKIIPVRLREESDWIPDDSLERTITEEYPRLVLFSNPSNPNGEILPGERMLNIARLCRSMGAVLCVDECFMDLSAYALPAGNRTALETVPDQRMTDAGSLTRLCVQEGESFPGLIVLNAITKTYAVPGVRLGFAFCGSEKLAETLREMLPEWNVSAAAEAAGIAAMQTERRYLEKAGEVIRNERAYLSEELTACGFHVCPSRADYLLFHGAEGLYDALLKKKILIRDCSDYEGLGKGWYRVAVKRHEDNEKLIKAVIQAVQTETVGRVEREKTLLPEYR